MCFGTVGFDGHFHTGNVHENMIMGSGVHLNFYAYHAAAKAIYSGHRNRGIKAGQELRNV